MLCALVASAMAVPTAHNYQLHERRDFIPKSWDEGKKVDGNVSLPVRIGLTQSNLDYGHELLTDLSNPSSRRYGQHLSVDEVYNLFAPTEKRVNDSANKQWIQFNADAEELENLLHTKYSVYSHVETGQSHVACREYHLPSSVRENVDYITPGISLREVTGVRRSTDKQKRFADGIPPIIEPIPLPIETLSSEASSFCTQAITPQCIQQMYNISEGRSAAEGNELGIFQGIGDVYAQEDLNLFFSKLYSFQGFLNTFLDAIDGSYCSIISPLDPPYPDPNEGGYKGSLQCGVPTHFISAVTMCRVHEARYDGSFSSGGFGRFWCGWTWGDPTSSNCLGPDGRIFTPDFPAFCPYLTAVGGTEIPTSSSPEDHKEQAVTRFPSGGGFSKIYKVPGYQAQAVADYFALTKPSYPYYESVDNSSFGENDGIYNRIGRAYPDVAAIGDHVIIYNKGMAVSIGGTSASAPVFAGILTRINEERLAAGKSTVGFVNPILYAHPEAFLDVTKGTNAGCKTDGFSATKGWDPVTGLGTPNYPELLRVFMAQ
ncbi:hypothetical protein N7463_008057 [Penicillium fimorum]|uniref:Peptidase S53 domain-containing protein n=1 Tax=Penicillium fimorum TaxID=1882269 RepID=A0A9W9XXJ9_9EURO|nr:hypothetical protein N7463_008057 [Penicillium fimorum]